MGLGHQEAPERPVTLLHAAGNHGELPGPGSKTCGGIDGEGIVDRKLRVGELLRIEGKLRIEEEPSEVDQEGLLLGCSPNLGEDLRRKLPMGEGSYPEGLLAVQGEEHIGAIDHLD